MCAHYNGPVEGRPNAWKHGGGVSSQRGGLWRANNRGRPTTYGVSSYYGDRRRTGGFSKNDLGYTNFGLNATTLTQSATCASSTWDPGMRDGTVVAVGAIGLVPQGDGPTTRDGKVQILKSMEIKGWVWHPGNNAGGAAIESLGHVSLYIVLDTQTNGSAFNSADCFENPLSSLGATVSTAMPFRKLEWNKRFRVLKELHISLNTNTMGVLAGPNFYHQTHAVPFHIYLRWPKGIEINYDPSSTTGLNTDVRDNTIHLCAFPSQSLEYNLQYTGRCRFKR